MTDTMTMTLVILIKTFDMKRYLLAIFVTILALASCSKDLDDGRINDDSASNGATTVLTFTSERPQLDPTTKTAWDADFHGIVWSTGDKIRIGFTFDGNWWSQKAAYNGSGYIKFYQSNGVAIDSDNHNIGTFTVPVTNAFTGPTESGDFVFYAVYPGSKFDTNQNGAPNVPITLKEYQIPAENSFDPETDILVGKSKTVTSTGLPSEHINLYWTRVVAHGNFTLKDFQGVKDDEHILKVVLTAQAGANLTGRQIVSVADGSFTGNGTSNVVTLDGTNLSFVKDEQNKTNINIWLSVMPVTLTALDVVVETNKATYHKSWSGISKTLQGNARNTMGINMATAETELKEEYYWVKRDISTITPSDIFVIVGDNGNTYAMSNDKGTSAAPQAVPVSVSDDRLTAEPAERIRWSLSKQDHWWWGTTYHFYPNGNTSTWLYCTGDNNGVRVGTDSDNNTFTISEGYIYNTNRFCAVGIYSSSDWRRYLWIIGNAPDNIRGQTFAFYVRVKADEPILPTPSISFNPSTTTVNVDERVSNIVSIEPSGLPVTYSSSNPNVVTVDPSTGELTGVSRGFATITAVFAGNTSYHAASTTCSVTVADPSRPYTITFEKGVTFTTNVTTYTSSFVNMCDGLSLTLANVNNGGNNNWTEMRAGRNNNTSVATITTNAPIQEAIKTVTLSITQANPSLVNSIRLIVSPNSNFSSSVSYNFSGTSQGDVTATVTNPTANMYYRIEIDLKRGGGSGDGFFRFNKIVYSAE